MPTNLTVDDSGVDIAFAGIDAHLALKRHVHLPLSEIDRAFVTSVDDARRSRGWRIAGGLLRGRFVTGRFTYRGRRGCTQLWSVYRDTEVLVIDLKGRRPARVVMQTADRDDLAAGINSLLAGRA